MSKFFQRRIKLHEPIGECNLWFLKKFTSAYLFQIAREKSCDYLLIICMKKFEMVKQKKLRHITQSGKNCIIKFCHPRRALDLKAKDLIGSFKNRIVYLANHNPEFRCVICTGITLFALVLHILHLCYRRAALLFQPIRIE